MLGVEGHQAGDSRIRIVASGRLHAVELPLDNFRMTTTFPVTLIRGRRMRPQAQPRQPKPEWLKVRAARLPQLPSTERPDAEPRAAYGV